VSTLPQEVIIGQCTEAVHLH